MDADSSVKTVYGRQQGTAKGYNPHKRGAPSYHPRANDWKQPRFFLAVRCRKDPQNDHPQGELLPLEDYDYCCYVTTEPLSPWQAHRRYGERATSETWIEEAKSQMGLAHLKTDTISWPTPRCSNALYWPTTPSVGWR